MDNFIILSEMLNTKRQYYINPGSKFIIWEAEAESGLPWKKIIIDP